MNAVVMLWGGFSVVFGAVFAYVTAERAGREQLHEAPDEAGRGTRFPSLGANGSLPGVFVGITAVCFALDGWERAVQQGVGMLAYLFCMICVYDTALLALLRVLRRHISARVCALLWLMPGYLCCLLNRPVGALGARHVIRVPGKLLYGILAVWAAGAIGVLLWRVAGHLRFRRRLLKGAVPVTDEAVLAVWQQELDGVWLKKPKCRPVRSAQATSPLSIGLWPRSVRVVLPQREYTQQELALIFRHELIHICREDMSAKFFMTFCTAMCWFQPLVWVAMRKSADDFERSCDEAALLDAKPDERRAYAQLLLRTAGDERGFTSCLSASARALRYRLKSVMEQGKKRSGAVVAGVSFAALVMSSALWSTAVAYDTQSGAARIFYGDEPGTWQLSSARVYDADGYNDCRCTDEAALGAYLAGLELERVTDRLAQDEDARELVLIYDTPRGVMGVTLYENMAWLCPLWEKNAPTYDYYLPQKTDWAYLQALFET